MKGLLRSGIIDKALFSSTRKRLLENFLSLSVLQVMNYILPLITLPYLVRILGPEKYGLIAFAQALIGYFIIITNYGFDLSASREISIFRDNKEKLSEIYCSVMVIKVVLLILCFFIMATIVHLGKFKSDWLVYYLTFGITVGQVLFPLWFFIGTEQMKYITILNVIDRTIFTVGIFVFIKSASNYIYVPLLNSLGYITSGLLSQIITCGNFKIRLRWPTKKNLLQRMKEGWSSFVATMSIGLYTNSNTFILGLFTNNTIVGYYSTVEKLVNAVERLFLPLSQTVYPRICKIAEESKINAVIFIRKILYLGGSCSFLVSLLMFIFAEPLVSVILGSQYHQSMLVLRIMAFLPFAAGLSNLFGFETMLAFKMDRPFAQILLAGGILDIILAVTLSPCLKHVGAAVAIMLTVVFVAITMFLYLENKGIRILSGDIRTVSEWHG